MVKIWSELPGPRAREVVADVATAAWLWLWGSLAWGLYTFLAGFAEAGRLVRGGGEGLQGVGLRLGDSLRGLPLVGEGAGDAVSRGFAGAGAPIVSAGRELETFVLIVAATLAFLLVTVPLVPWLLLYLPWRITRLRRVRAAHRAIRRTSRPLGEPAKAAVPAASVQRVLAARALNRLEWTVLLDHSPDPIGDWEAGRYDRLARAELEEVGLRA